MKRSLGPELPSELRAELERSRRAGRDYDVLAKLPQLRAALDAARAPADGPSAEHAPTSDASPFSSAHLAPSAWKLVLLAATAGATVWLTWPVLRRQPAPARPAPAVHHAEPAAPAPPPGHEAEPAAGSAELGTKQPASEGVAAQPAPTPQPSERSSRREIAELVRIRALLEHDPAAAYRLAQQSEREFPHGLLSEERQALQVLALAKSGSIEAAERKAQEFFARYPQSPMRERLEAALRR